MPRSVRSNGRSGGSSTATYSDAHEKAATRDWPARVSLTNPTSSDADGAWDAGSGRTSFGAGVAATPYATGLPARVQATANVGGVVADVAEDDVTEPRYLVQMHPEVVAQVGTVVTVTACSEDPQLVGRSLRVAQVVVGTETFTRDLFCTLLEPAVA